MWIDRKEAFLVYFWKIILIIVIYFRYKFALDGRSFDVLRMCFPDIYEKVLVRCVVCARMSPEQKQILVESLQRLGYYVGKLSNVK